MVRTVVLLVLMAVLMSLVPTAGVHGKDSPTPAIPPNPEPRPRVEALLHDRWRGGPCVGTLDLSSDGSFRREHYSPGNNTITGTWEVRWDALPPTLVTTCKASDAPDRIKMGAVTELKILKLNAKELTLEYAEGGQSEFERVLPAEKGRGSSR